MFKFVGSATSFGLGWAAAYSLRASADAQFISANIFWATSIVLFTLAMDELLKRDNPKP